VRRGSLLLVLLPLALAGCAGRATVPDCLNAKGFLVRDRGNVVRGSSPGGVNFTLTVYPRRSAERRAVAADGPATSVVIGDAVIDFAGNPPATPGGIPGRLTSNALATIRRCLARP
jgi:hypothetical protein